MTVSLDRFLGDLTDYAKQTQFDYSYYLISSELKRMRIMEKLGDLVPSHMNPILLFLRDWMPSGWVMWSEKKGKRWELDQKLCQVLNKLRVQFASLAGTDITHFQADQHSIAVERIFKDVHAIDLGSSQISGSTVTSKIMHLLNPELFVMWDTDIIGAYGLEASEKGYREFLTTMKEFAISLQPHLDRIKQTQEDLRLESAELYGAEFYFRKSFAKLLDEYNWIEVHWKKSGEIFGKA